MKLKILTQIFLLLNVSLLAALVFHAVKFSQAGLLSSPVNPESRFPIATVQQVASHLIHHDASFVDARPFETYRKGHIPTAVNVPVGGGIPMGSLQELLEAREVVVYCDGPTCNASSKVAQVLLDHGIRKISILSEGWPAWVAAGMPVMTVHEALPKPIP